MKWLQNTWTKRFNASHRLSGHVFGGRYKSVLVEDGAYLESLINYIHLNCPRSTHAMRDAAFSSESGRGTPLCG